MRATTLHSPGDIRLSTVPDPTIEHPTDAVVRVLAGCICGTDLWPYRGVNKINPGETMGHECVGIVEEVGAAVTSFRPGDFVVVPFDHCDNTCVNCVAGMQAACAHLNFTETGQAEYARVAQADGSLCKTDGVPQPTLVPSLLALSDVMATGWHAAVSAGVKPGMTAVIVGDGAVGLCGVLAACAMGAEKIVAMSRHSPLQALATQLGATHIVAERGDEGIERVLEITRRVGADAVLECVGTDQSIATAFEVTRPGSVVGFVGAPHGVVLPVSRMFQKNIGLAGRLAPVRRYLPELMELVLSGAINPGVVFDRTLPLSDVAEGYRLMDQREAVKVLLQP
jgi:threonine dehydrogenase-like Zn-dependent dehydrogenase